MRGGFYRFDALDFLFPCFRVKACEADCRLYRGGNVYHVYQMAFIGAEIEADIPCVGVGTFSHWIPP